MFEVAELGRKVSKQAFNAAAPELRERMVAIQQSLRELDFPVIVLFAGVDGAGKSETVNLLNEWMDPRWIVTRAYDKPSDEETERPQFWRYWRDLPPKGQVGLFLSAWYTAPLLDRVYGRIGKAKLEERLVTIRAFERTLADDGALILKFWMHLGHKAQKKRLKKLEKDPLHHWKVTKRDWDHVKRYDRFIPAAEQIITGTSTHHAPWTLVEGADDRYRSLTVMETLYDRIQAHARDRADTLALRKTEVAQAKRRRKPAAVLDDTTILSSVDLSPKAALSSYGRELKELRARLHGLYVKAKAKGVSTALAFEGWDAGGKGGAIRRVASAMDARDVRVLPVAAPTDEERAQHYLWRFWRHMPRAGRFVIFDRSWYGRVLVERVEHFAAPSEWQRAFTEINDFEKQLTEQDMVLVKFWLHIDKDEQARRFAEREKIPYKRWKLTDEDWRNREKWDAYAQAVNDMIEKTSTEAAPWVIIEGNDKKFARLKVLRTLCDRLEARLG